jgi:hypothetical protein
MTMFFRDSDSNGGFGVWWLFPPSPPEASAFVGKGGHQQIGIKMEWEIRIQAEEKYLEVITHGVADQESSLQMAKNLTETMRQKRITRVLIDHRQLENVSGGTIEIYQRPKLFSLIGLIFGVKIAEIIKPEHLAHFRFFETVSRNQGFRISIFQDKSLALEWLLQ